MAKSLHPLDSLISETLNRIHGRAFHEGLTISPRNLDTVGSKNTGAHQKLTMHRNRRNSLLAVAASFLLIVGLGLSVLNSLQDSTNSDESKRLRTADKVNTTVRSHTDNKNKNDVSTTTNPLDFTDENTPTTTPKDVITPSTTPFHPGSSPTPTTPAAVNQLARVSYSNTRGNDVALDGATISGNVYIFISNTDVYSALWFLDDGGKFEKNTQFRGGKTLPIDFNYRESDKLTPKPFDTSQWSVGEHTLGIETKSISTGKYSRVLIKFYVTR